jgi:hypothetical protein
MYICISMCVCECVCVCIIDTHTHNTHTHTHIHIHTHVVCTHTCIIYMHQRRAPIARQRNCDHTPTLSVAPSAPPPSSPSLPLAAAHRLLVQTTTQVVRDRAEPLASRQPTRIYLRPGLWPGVRGLVKVGARVVKRVWVGAQHAAEQHVGRVDGAVVRSFRHVVHSEPRFAALELVLRRDASDVALGEQVFCTVCQPQRCQKCQVLALFLPPHENYECIQMACCVKLYVYRC